MKLQKCVGLDGSAGNVNELLLAEGMFARLLNAVSLSSSLLRLTRSLNVEDVRVKQEVETHFRAAEDRKFLR